MQQAIRRHGHLHAIGVGIRSGGECSMQLERIGSLLRSSARRLPSSSQWRPERRMLQGSEGSEPCVSV